MQRVLGRGMRLAALLLAAICLYTGLMLVAYSFPDEWISDNVGAAVGMLTEEGNMVGGYANYFWHTGFSITDNPVSYTHLDVYKRQGHRRAGPAPPAGRPNSDRRLGRAAEGRCGAAPR